MRYKYPSYYKTFACIAKECEATCCAGWEIVIDDESLDRYLKEASGFGNRLCNSIDFQQGIFHQDCKKRCAFLNEENLCDIYAELGAEALCYTCTQYPRHIEEFEEVNEVSLSISCPEVARIILNTVRPITFYEEEIEEDVEGFEAFDFLFYELLYESREVLFQILQNRQLEMDDRMNIAQSMCKEMQEKIEGYETFAIDQILQQYEEGNVKAIHEEESERYIKIQKQIMELYQLEVLQETWHPYLLSCQESLYQQSYEAYQKERKGFLEKYQSVIDRMKEQLMVYFVYSYYCGGVYDGEIYAKYQLAHITTCIIEELWLAKYMENQGEISNQEMCNIVYRYAREIEHSDENLDILEEIYKG